MYLNYLHLGMHTSSGPDDWVRSGVVGGTMAINILNSATTHPPLHQGLTQTAATIPHIPHSRPPHSPLQTPTSPYLFYS